MKMSKTVGEAAVDANLSQIQALSSVKEEEIIEYYSHLSGLVSELESVGHVMLSLSTTLLF